MHQPNKRASARTPSRASAREMLATAHKSMKKAAIAEHALAMADELERMRSAFGNALEGLNAAAAAVASFEELVRILQADIRTASALFQSGKKRQARELLARMAGVPELEQFSLPTHQAEWSAAVFNPADAQAH